jgi:rod shape-determining protein MreB
MIGKAPPDTVVVRPLKGGVISDFDAVSNMLVALIKKAQGSALGAIVPRPQVIVSVPHGITHVEIRAAHDAVLRANARAAYVVEEPIAAAIGAGLPLDEPLGSMIVDIGAGATEVTVMALGGIIINHTLPVAGDAIDDAIVQFARREYNLLIGERMAERAKIAAGSAEPLDEEVTVMLRGRNMLNGLPRAVEVSSVELRAGIAGVVDALVAGVRAALEETPPELLADIVEHGIRLAGGGALLKGMAGRIAAETRMPVHVADKPLECMARGMGILAQELSNPLYRAMLAGAQPRRSAR